MLYHEYDGQSVGMTKMYRWRWSLLIAASALSMAVVACGEDTSTSASSVGLPEPTQAPSPTVSLPTQPEPATTAKQPIPSTPGPAVAVGRGETSRRSSGPTTAFADRRSGGFVSLDNPVFLPASEASHLGDDELVLGYEFEGEARAYPINMMRFYHIVNDSLGGSPVLITY